MQLLHGSTQALSCCRVAGSSRPSSHPCLPAHRLPLPSMHAWHIISHSDRQRIRCAQKHSRNAGAVCGGDQRAKGGGALGGHVSNAASRALVAEVDGGGFVDHVGGA